MDKTNAKLKFLYLVVTALNHDSYEKDENVNFGFYVYLSWIKMDEIFFFYLVRALLGTYLSFLT